MWVLLRLSALIVLAVVTALVAGRGDALVTASGRAAEALGAGPVAAGGGSDLGRAATVAVLATGSVAAVVRPPARAIRQIVTLVHELGHTVVAAALGARPSGIVLRHDASGHATARWVGAGSLGRRFALATVAFAGVPAATVATAAGAELLSAAGSRPVLWSLAAVGLTVAALARSPWSLAVAVALAGLASAALRDVAEPWADGAVIGLLTAVAVRAVLDDLRALRSPIRDGDDARAVGRQVWLPAKVVQLTQVVVSVAAGSWTVWVLAAGLRTGG
jgi:hypothetical protein